MTASELITQFVDGELGEVQETELYSKLLSEEAYRKEMHEHLAIRESVRIDTEAFNPPLQATASVFNALGFSVPQASAPVQKFVVSSGSTIILSLLKKFAIPVLSVLLATVATFWLTQSHYQNKIDTIVKSSINQQSTMNSSLAQQSSSNPSLPVVSSTGNDKNLNVVNLNNRNSYLRSQRISSSSIADNSISETNNKSDNSSNNIESDNNKTIETQIERNYSRYVPISNVARISPTSIPQYSQNGPQMSIMPALFINTDNKYFIELNGISAHSFINAPSYTSNSLENLNFSIYYNYKPDIIFGVTAGEEAYGQNLTPSRHQTSKIPYNPLVFWIGASGRFYYNSYTLYPFKPFAQVIFGTSQPGIVSKLILGTQFDLGRYALSLRNLSLTAGFEGSSLLYLNQGSYCASNKIGFTGGFMYNF